MNLPSSFELAIESVTGALDEEDAEKLLFNAGALDPEATLGRRLNV